jgi:hypothetical protein
MGKLRWWWGGKGGCGVNLVIVNLLEIKVIDLVYRYIFVIFPV